MRDKASFDAEINEATKGKTADIAITAVLLGILEVLIDIRDIQAKRIGPGVVYADPGASHRPLRGLGN